MALALVDHHPRPALRLIPGGLGAAPTPAAYRRRRVVALVLAVAVVVVALAGARAVLRPLAGTSGARPLGATELPVPVPAGASTPVVVPGETLWDVARELQPTGDVRPVVDELAALNGGATLQAGQVLVLPG
jgi:Tfp pilus assembly protein FimV